MNLEGIISIAGKGGLFKLKGQSKSHLIVEQIGENKRMPVYATDRVSALSDISIYTEDDDVPLGDVFQKIYDREKGGSSIDHKSSAEELRASLADVLPDYDEERVYNSDLKKLFQWYNLLQASGSFKEILENTKEKKAEETVEEAEVVEDAAEPSEEQETNE